VDTRRLTPVNADAPAGVHSSACDVLQLLVGDLSHLIRAPRELYVDEEPLGLITFQIIDAEGVRQIITLREPLRLPVPHALLT